MWRGNTKEKKKKKRKRKKKAVTYTVPFPWKMRWSVYSCMYRVTPRAFS